MRVDQPRSVLFAAVLAVVSAALPARADDASVPSVADQRRRETVVAHVGDVTITVGELEDTLGQAPEPIRHTYLEPARRREFLDNMVQTILLAQEARRRGLDRQPEPASAIRRILAQRVEQAAIIEAVTSESITDAAVSAYYQAHLGDYQQPEFRRATVLIVADRPTADQLATAARSARGDMRRLQVLVRERSIDPATRDHDGDLFYFRRDGMATGTPSGQTHVDTAIATAAFGLAREMEVSAPAHLADGRWAIVVLTGIRPSLSRALGDPGVNASIRGYLVRERRTQRERELLEELRAQLHPEVHDELLDQLRIPTQDLGTMPGFDPADRSALPRRPPTATGARPTPAPSAPVAPPR